MVYCAGKLVENLKLFCKSNRLHFLWVYRKSYSKPRIRDYSNFSEANFLEDLSQLDLDRLVTSKDDPNQSFSTFYNKVNTIINKHAPLKPISNRRAKQSHKPWITKAIRKSIMIKNSLF